MGESTSSDPLRRVAVEAARQALRQERGILVVGEPGWGRTHFVRRVLEGFDEELSPRLWIGDDIEQVDDARARKLVEAVVSQAIVPVMTARPHRPLSAPLERLLRDGVVQRIELKPLDQTAMLEVVASLLGGPLDPLAVPAFVPRRPGGDLVVLQQAVHEAVADGTLGRVDQTWHLKNTIPPYPIVRRLIHARIGALTSVTAEAQTVLDVIALAPELALAQLERVLVALGSGEDRAGHLLDPPIRASSEELRYAFETLEGDGVIDVVELGGALRLQLHDPVVELILPQTVGRLRKVRLATAIVDLLSERPVAELGAGEAIALARLALPLGRATDPEALTAAAEAALRRSRIELAFQLGSAAIASGGGIDSELVLAAAESQLGRSAAALARLDGLLADPQPDADRRTAIDELRRLVVDRLAEPASRWSLPSRSGVAADMVDLESTLRLSAIVGDPDPALGSDPSRQSVVLEGERIALASSLATLRGERTRAFALLAEGEALLRASGADTFRIRWERAFAGAYERPLEETVALALGLASEAAAKGQGGQQGVSEWLAGSLLIAGGRAGKAVLLLRNAVWLLEENGVFETGMLARATLTIALAALGAVEEASENLRPVTRASEGQPFLEGWALQALGWVHAASGRLDDAAATFARAADAHVADGYALSGILALVESARSGNATAVLPRVGRLAGQVEGACIVVAVDFVRALAARERLLDGRGRQGGQLSAIALAEQFDAVGEAAVHLGRRVYAAEAFSLASELFAGAGRDRSATASARRVDEVRAASEDFATPFVSTQPMERLSRREQEISRLAAEGRSNREIAEKLVLSIRTVETHLLRVYRKLGVRGRSELQAAVTGSDTGITGTPMALQDGELNS